MTKFVPLKHLIDPNRPLTYGIVQAGEDCPGGVPYIRPTDMDGHRGVNIEALRTTAPEIAAEYQRSIVRPGDIVVSIGPGYGKTMVVPPELDGANLTQGTARVAPTKDVDHRFLLWALQSKTSISYWDSEVAGATFKALNLGPLGRTPIPTPSRTEQGAIADYLDRETAQIDTLIGEQRRLIAMLRERRQASVDRTVWRGLDTASTAATGVEPAPIAPAHWRRLRNKNLLSESDDLSADGTEELLTVSHLTGITRRSEKNVTMIEAESLDGYRVVKRGDLVINTMWAWMGALGVSRLDGIVSPAYGVYRPQPGAEFDSTYYDYLYRSQPYVVEMTRYSRGIWSSRLRIYPEVFLRLPIVAPPIDEQRAIAAYLDEQTSKIDALIVESERFIELALERRSALITAAVTEQIDLRGKAA